MKAKEIERLLKPYLAEHLVCLATGSEIFEQLATYLELVLRWNERTNLTAIRTPEGIVRRHFGESLFVGAQLGKCKTLLDFGSGAGFPGLPIQLMQRELKVTLAESQGKKASFLREAVRILGLNTEIWSHRVETMPKGRTFDVVVMRAVDKMDSAVLEAGRRGAGEVVVVGTEDSAETLELLRGSSSVCRSRIPETSSGVVWRIVRE